MVCVLDRRVGNDQCTNHAGDFICGWVSCGSWLSMVTVLCCSDLHCHQPVLLSHLPEWYCYRLSTLLVVECHPDLAFAMHYFFHRFIFPLSTSRPYDSHQFEHHLQNNKCCKVVEKRWTGWAPLLQRRKIREEFVCGYTQRCGPKRTRIKYPCWSRVRLLIGLSHRRKTPVWKLRKLYNWRKS